MEATLRSTGNLSTRVIHAKRAPLSWRLHNALRWVYLRGWLGYHAAPIFGRLFGFGTFVSSLRLMVRKADGEMVDYGVASYRVVTTVGVTAMALSFGTQASPGNFFYHGIGTGAGAEAVGDTQIATECTTQYNPDNTRATGTHTEAAGVYTTVGTNTVDEIAAVTEHGILTQAATGGGSLLDRHLFAAVNLASGDGLQSTYTLTFTAGG